LEASTKLTIVHAKKDASAATATPAAPPAGSAGGAGAPFIETKKEKKAREAREKQEAAATKAATKAAAKAAKRKKGNPSALQAPEQPTTPSNRRTSDLAPWAEKRVLSQEMQKKATQLANMMPASTNDGGEIDALVLQLEQNDPTLVELRLVNNAMTASLSNADRSAVFSRLTDALLAPCSRGLTFCFGAPPPPLRLEFMWCWG
jgi:hypothetical protein